MTDNHPHDASGTNLKSVAPTTGTKLFVERLAPKTTIGVFHTSMPDSAPVHTMCAFALHIAEYIADCQRLDTLGALLQFTAAEIDEGSYADADRS